MSDRVEIMLRLESGNAYWLLAKMLSELAALGKKCNDDCGRSLAYLNASPEINDLS